MNVRKGTPPLTIERPLEIDLPREEVLAVLVNYIKSKFGPNLRFEDILVAGDEGDKLRNVTLSGVEILPLNWKDSLVTPAASAVVPAPVVAPPQNTTLPIKDEK